LQLFLPVERFYLIALQYLYFELVEDGCMIFKSIVFDALLVEQIESLLKTVQQLFSVRALVGFPDGAYKDLAFANFVDVVVALLIVVVDEAADIVVLCHDLECFPVLWLHAFDPFDGFEVYPFGFDVIRQNSQGLSQIIGLLLILLEDDG
jgi:hypothetical protein